MKSIKILRCPICYLIPKIFNSKFNEWLEPSFTLKILCPNSHLKYIYNETILKKNTFSLTDIPCKICNLKNNSKYYCKECYSILCDICLNKHITNYNHKDIKTIYEIDNICLIHNEKFNLYCKTCELEICKECFNSKVHKEHEINELKTLNIIKIKNDIKKYINNFKKKLEKKKIKEINNFKSNFSASDYSSIYGIEEDYKSASKNLSRYLNIINDLINQYELYIEYYKIPSYNLYQNINLIYKCYNNENLIYCNKHEKDLIKIYNYKDYDSYINKSVYEKGVKYGCGLYKDEVGDLIYVYYNFDREILFFFNLETWNYKKEIKIEIGEKKKEFEYYFIFYKLNNIELFLVYEKKQNIISIYDIKDQFNYQKIFFIEFESKNAGKVYIDYINNRILIFFITSYEIYVFNINNQIVLKLCTNEVNLKSIFFFEIKPFGKMLFFSNDNEGIIYKLKNFQLFKKIDIIYINKVTIGDIFDKKCLIVLSYYKEIIQIIDFKTNEIIYRYKIKFIFPYYKINYMFLFNSKIYFIYSDEYNAAGIGEINLITDKSAHELHIFNMKYYDGTHLIEPFKLLKIKLKNFGECILALPKWKTERHESIKLYYFKENININIKEEINKKDELENILKSFESYKNKYKRTYYDYNKYYIKYLEKEIKKHGYKSDEELLNRIKQLENNSKIINNNIELYDIKLLIYKRNKQEYKNNEKYIQEIFKDIDNYKREFSLVEEKRNNRFKIPWEKKENEEDCNAEIPDLFG